jgi:osmotically-inducible protein OsmY
MRSDKDLTADVLEALRWEPSIAAQDIHVTAENGVVTLTGFVPNYADKWAAESTARQMNGVKAIAEELKVNLPGGSKRSDTDIATAAVNTLRWHVWVPDSVKATVENGWITLTGTVSSEYQRKSAQHAVAHLRGVVGVSNSITVTSDVKPISIREAITKAFNRDSEIEADGIDIATEGSSVTLSGKIKTWGERDRAGTAAWNAPGVTTVDNKLVVSY